MDTRKLICFCLLLTYPGMVLTQTCTSPTPSCDCFITQGKKNINCRYKSLTAIPTFKYTAEVYDEIRFDSTEETGQCQSGVGCNYITTLNANAFANLTVKVINLLNNPIATVDYNAFTDLTDVLEGLFLEGNGNTGPPYQAIAPLENLQALHLENYTATIIQLPAAVLPFPKLAALTLKKWAQLQTLRADVFRVMSNLSSFSLQDLPSLVNLPVQTIHMFLHLTTIEVKATGITTIFDEVFAPLSSLSEVKIRQNQNLRTIQDRAFFNVTDTIEFLDLDGNKLSNLPFLSFYTWTKLSHLNIGYNLEISTLPSGIFSKMPTMDYLQCQDIGLTSLNEAIFTNLQNLHTIDLSYNKIQNIGTGTLRHSPNLVEIRLNNQDTKGTTITFQDNAFNGTENSTEILNLSGNKLNLAQLWIDLSRLTNVRILELDNVGITSIPNRTFAQMTKLNAVHLPRNNITDVNQETFFGPKNTLTLIDLQSNQIRSIGSCVLSDFPTKPSLHLAENQLRCDCDLVWLYDLVKSDPRLEKIYEIGKCTSPDSLASKYFDEFTRNDMCSGGSSVPNCPDLYATTTTSTTTSTSTTAPTTTTTEIPIPSFTLILNNAASTSMDLTWVVQDKTYLTGLKIEMIPPEGSKQIKNLGAEEISYTFYQLQPDTFHTFCLVLKINGVYRDSQPKCISKKTLPEFKTTVPTTLAPEESDSQLGLIIGASVGSLVLVALLVAIVVVILKYNKPKEPKHMSEPVSYTMRANMPHEGGTAKRFAKKADKESAELDDINVTVISNGDMSNRDRISAGSYQTLNEKGVDHRPMPGFSHGHYTNSVEDRPLPRAPHGASNWSGGATGHGYVNSDNKNGHLPEISKNEYSEVRY